MPNLISLLRYIRIDLHIVTDNSELYVAMVYARQLNVHVFPLKLSQKRITLKIIYIQINIPFTVDWSGVEKQKHLSEAAIKTKHNTAVTLRH